MEFRHWIQSGSYLYLSGSTVLFKWSVSRSR